LSDSLTTLELAQQLIARPSITPDDHGCQQLLAQYLTPLGFNIQSMAAGDVSNLWAVRGSSGPLLVFAGHTDVVPPGPLGQWHSHPFQPELRQGYLYGRGAADMKGSLAAMITACQAFIGQYPHHPGRIALLITSDEEGPAKQGTKVVMERLTAQGEHIDWCIVGEPSSQQQLGDTVKNGRRGSLGAHLRIKGKQGHIAYPELAINPLHNMLPALQPLVDEIWDRGNDFFPPTQLQISNINGGTGAVNVIPGEVDIHFNLRFSTEVTYQSLQRRIETLLNRQAIDYTIDWQLNGLPFLTQPGELTAAVSQSISDVLGTSTQFSTAGGTSDGRFIAPGGAQVVEFGPVNRTIHQVNECVKANDLDELSLVYQRILYYLLIDKVKGQ
jgi:succinyl-diaminopimelate desuccinylase